MGAFLSKMDEVEYAHCSLLAKLLISRLPSVNQPISRQSKSNIDNFTMRIASSILFSNWFRLKKKLKKKKNQNIDFNVTNQTKI